MNSREFKGSTAPLKTITFIDAGQFRPAIVNQRLQMEYGKRFDWIRFKSVMDEIAGGNVFDVHYFDCVSDAPSAGREAFHQFLRNTLAFQLHFSELREKRRTCQVCREQYLEHEQKGVDVGIAVHMLKLGYSNAYEQAILCSGDGDFSSLVNYLRDSLGKRVIVVGWHNGVAPALRDAAFRVIELEDFQTKIVGNTTSHHVGTSENQPPVTVGAASAAGSAQASSVSNGPAG